MAKKLVKKRKIRILRLLILLFALAILVFFAWLYLKSSIRNIIIRGNNYLNDEEILEIAGLTNYPSYIFTFTGKIEKKLESNKYIERVDVDREFYHKLVINIKEVEILFRDENSNRYILSNGKKITSNKNIRVPRLINYTPDDKYKKFITNMNEVKKSILGKISEIKYDPNEFDKDRFLLLMDDGNSVFLTLTKFEMI
ncbi:MAG: FtsQ-type POTRA domain-containing protein, partial [Bacilli bacterium]|nr:FtsQ-type POTRA domain-containing protein [Bacilli bacterium]